MHLRTQQPGRAALNPLGELVAASLSGMNERGYLNERGYSLSTTKPQATRGEPPGPGRSTTRMETLRKVPTGV